MFVSADLEVCWYVVQPHFPWGNPKLSDMVPNWRHELLLKILLWWPQQLLNPSRSQVMSGALWPCPVGWASWRQVVSASGSSEEMAQEAAMLTCEWLCIKIQCRHVTVNVNLVHHQKLLWVVEMYPYPRGKPPGHSSLVCHGFETTSHLLIGVQLANEVSRAIQLWKR